MNSPQPLRSSLLTEAGFVAHGFSTRIGGCSPAPYDSWNFSTSTGDTAERVEENYEILARFLGGSRDCIKGVHQIHSSRVVQVAQKSDETASEKADGLLSSVPGVVVGVKTADCVPVLLALPAGDGHPAMVAAVHAGWRGVEGEIVLEAISQMKAISNTAVTSRLLVAIGPHICADCFQVGPEVAEVFPLHHRHDPSAEGKYLVDLRAVLRDQLVGVGIALAHIEQVMGCTLCDEQGRFFSHRGSGGACGRLFNFIGTP